MSVKTRAASALSRTPLLLPAFRLYERLVALRWHRALAPRSGRDELPLPPPRLRVLVTGSADPQWFLESGRDDAETIAKTVDAAGVAMSDLGTMLDFGCGCGRVIRHWRHLETTQVFGSDYNEDLVAWCRRNLAFATFSVNDLAPPLPFDDETFDFVYAISVLTHLTEELGLRWMAELQRVIRPGGLLLVSTHGDAFVDRLAPEEQEAFRRGDLVVKRAAGVGSNLCSAYHPRAYVQEKLAPGFRVESYETARLQSQDVILLRKLETAAAGIDREMRLSVPAASSTR